MCKEVTDGVSSALISCQPFHAPFSNTLSFLNVKLAGFRFVDPFTLAQEQSVALYPLCS